MSRGTKNVTKTSQRRPTIRKTLMAFRQFTMFPRKAKKGKPVFYVRFRDPETDKRLTTISSGRHSKQVAEMWAIEQLKKGLITTKSNMTFFGYRQVERFTQGKGDTDAQGDKAASVSHARFFSYRDGVNPLNINHTARKSSFKEAGRTMMFAGYSPLKSIPG